MSTGKDGLKDPLMLMRPAPFWSWNDKLDEAELRRQIREMAAKGWGGFFMHSRVGLVTGYLSDEWFRMVRACADEAAKTGTFAWIYDEDKWPSGFAGGIVPDNGERFRQKVLVLLKKGSTESHDTVLSSVRFGGAQYEICRRVVPNCAWFNGSSYVDVMNPEVTREFLQCTHEKYKEACGEYFGKSIPGIFTDEPCYTYTHFSVDDPSVPWSDLLPDAFLKRKGYDITEKLPLLFFDLDGYRKVRYDFYDVATELFRESFSKQYYDWCEANGLILTGHFMCEDSLTWQTQWSGDVMSHYEYMHWPGVDKLLRSVDRITPPVFPLIVDPLIAVKQVATAVDQLGKERAFCETFGCAGGQVSFFHRKWIGDWQAALGISFVNHHLSLYSMRGERKRDCPPNLFYRQPWWEDERGFADYQARLCAAVSEGTYLVDVLVLQPLSSVWSEYSPLHSDSGYAAEMAYDEPFSRISHQLVEEKLQFHYGNENLMAKYGTVEEGAIKVGECSYRCVVLPPSQNIRSTTLELLTSYVKAGGKLVVVGRLPSYVDGSAAEVDLSEAVVVSNTQAAVSLISEMFPERISVIDKLTGKTAPVVFVYSRGVGESARHLIVNTDEKREVRAQITLPAGYGSETGVFDLYEGRMHRLPTKNRSFDAILYPAGSMLIICGGEVSDDPSDPPLCLGSGVFFVDLSKELPAVVVDSFDCRLSEENVLPLDNFALTLDGRKVYEGPVCGAWHEHFYPAAEGARFECTYVFHSECIVDGCFAAIEMAENLDSIVMNGISLQPVKPRGKTGAFDAEESWKDVSFTRVPLPPVSVGVNSLVISGRKCNNITGPGCHSRVDDWTHHLPTEAEHVHILGEFGLKRVSEGSYVITKFRKPTGRNLTHEGFPFYCGRMKLRSTFSLDEDPTGQVVLKLNGLSAASARITINGTECGAIRWQPYALDISGALRQGQNEIEIDAATTLVNAFGPNRRAGIKDETGISQFTFIEMDRFTEEYQLFDFGVESIAIYTIAER